MTEKINKRKFASCLHLPFSHNLYYKYVGKHRQCLSKEEQIFLIDGKKVPYQHHPLSLHGTPTKKARPRAQLTEEHAGKLHLQVVDEKSSNVTKVVFPNGRVNYVLLARRTSSCPALRALHGCMAERGTILDEFLSKLDKKRLLKDDLGGGRYVVSGFGNMGRNVSAIIRPPDQPALRKSLKLAEHLDLAKIVGEMFSHVSKCIAKHCVKVYEANQRLMKTNQKLAWPPLEYQKSGWKWMSTQFIVRRWGPALAENNWPLEKEIVAAHTDPGDLDCTMFHCYRTGGGRDRKGGAVAGTDIAVFEKANGEAGFRVKTCIRDTVVVVIFNSNTQLHGCIKSRDNFVEDDSVWSTRIIPYVTQGVHNWMIRNPAGSPFTNIP